MELFWEYVLLALSGVFGAVVHLGVKWRDALTKKVQMDWRLHIINSSFSMLVVLFLLLFRNELDGVYPITKLSIFMASYMADSAWKNITRFSGEKFKLNQQQ